MDKSAIRSIRLVIFIEYLSPFHDSKYTNGYNYILGFQIIIEY
jgi:hypothetical protein